MTKTSRAGVDPDACPICGKPRERREVKTPWSTIPVMIMCACEVAEEEAREAAKKAAYIEQLRAASGMPLEQRRYRLEDYKPSAGTRIAHATCVRYVEIWGELCADGRGLLLTGNPGCGKTHLAAGICNALIDREVNARWVTSVELLQRIQSTYADNDDTVDSVLQPIKACPLLVLDDLGTEKPSEWTMTILHSLIDHRYSNLRPTIITTNLTVQQLGKVLGARTLDRVLDTHRERYAVLEMEATSWRRRTT